jgi:hypothetical protein
MDPLEQTVTKIDFKIKLRILDIKENLHIHVYKSLNNLNDEQKCEVSNCLFDLLKDIYRWT